MDVIVNSDYVLTPYYDGIITDTTRPFWYEYQFNNYTPYDFFVLKTRLTYDVPQGYNIHFDSFRYEGQMRYCVLLSNGYTIVPINKEQTAYYQNSVDQIILNHPHHCTLVQMNQPFVTTNHDQSLPQRWVKTILPYCYKQLIKEQYQPILFNNQLLINIDPTRVYDDTDIKNNVDDYYKDYNAVYDVLQTNLINNLFNLYQQGIIVLNKDLDDDFINHWQLKPYYNTGNQTQIYVARWTNKDIKDKTAFLENQLRLSY